MKESNRGRKRRVATERFLDECGDFLRAIEWKPLTAGDIRITERGKFKYSLTIDFTGVKRLKSSAPAPDVLDKKGDAE